MGKRKPSARKPKRVFVTLDETTVDATEVVGYQRAYDAKLNQSEITIVLKGGAVLKLQPTDELHTPDMILSLEAAIAESQLTC